MLSALKILLTLTYYTFAAPSSEPGVVVAQEGPFIITELEVVEEEGAKIEVRKKAQKAGGIEDLVKPIPIPMDQVEVHPVPVPATPEKAE